jgi:hypothetical protein
MGRLLTFPIRAGIWFRISRPAVGDHGDQPLPGQPGGLTVPVVVTLDPGTGDQSSRIQATLWRVAQRPLDTNGFRGAILLKAGTWEINRTLLIDQSGIVLRGEGRDPSGVHAHLEDASSTPASRGSGTALVGLTGCWAWP